MIKEIKLNKFATYTKLISMSPMKINFCYGSNGSGKTTLTNYLGKYETPIACEIVWENSIELPTLVYNKKFVETNFGENKGIGGIFTLGKDTKDEKEYIAKLKTEVDNCETLISGFAKSKRKIEEDQDKLNSEFDDTCWSVQQTYGAKFSEALSGYRGSKKIFRAQCLKIFPKMDDKKPPTINEIEDLYSTVYGETRSEYSIYSEIDIGSLVTNEKCHLLAQRISGSSETPVGKFIEFLNNSDWVKQGIGFAKEADGICPYCQQKLPLNFQQHIEEYFDESYETDCSEIKIFGLKYEAFSKSILMQLQNIIDSPIPLLKYDLLKSERALLSSSFDANRKVISNKVASPSTKLSIDSVEPIILRINKIIKEYNIAITRNNEIVKNHIKERQRCQNLLWQYFAYELRVYIQQFLSTSESKGNGIKSLVAKIDEQENKKKEFQKSKEEKEKTLTSVLPTVNAINGILNRFGFSGFQLAENIEERGTYKIIRPDGSNARQTLSEGEYNFITFLYFYHLVYGSQDKTGISSNKVVVIDDPISSLDSNVLFIISTLVRTILRDCNDGKDGIQQVFLMTHNVFFYKEVTFLGSGKQNSTKTSTYWIIKKINNISDIINHENNPIRTSYELLWAELKDVDNQKRAIIFNTLRRILEYYFNVIGGLNYEKCIDQFEGEDKILCKALISCINDGSHFISDDFVMCFETDTIENYLRVFKLIFEKMQHGSHYQMMMGESTK